jgi:uncharacterized BrkB/YihY/UPF0761 family membrane protein
MIDSLIIVTVQILFFASFLYFSKLWLKRKNNVYPIIFYWVFGIFFIFLMGSNILAWSLKSLPYEKDSMGSLSSVIALVLYIYIGLQYFKKEKV